MKILYAQTMIFPNHSAHAIHTSVLAANFAAAGADVCYFPGLPGKYEKQILENFYASLGCGIHTNLSLKRIPVSHKGLYGALFRFNLWKEAAASKKHDTVFFASSVKEAVIALQLRKLIPEGKKIPVVFEAHHLISKLKTGSKARSLYKMEKAAFEQSDLVIFIADALRRDAQGYLPDPKQSLVSHLGFNDRIIRPIPEPPLCEEVHVAYLGSLQQGKGVEELVEAMVLLPQNYRLKIIGGRPESAVTALRAQVIRMGLENRVTFTGQVPHGEVAQHLTGSDIFAIPLNAENDFYCPMKMYEAVGYCIPIVSTPLPSILEVLKDEHAIFSRNTSPDALAEAIISLGENRELRLALRRSTAALAEQLKASLRAKFLLKNMQSVLLLQE